MSLTILQVAAELREQCANHKVYMGIMPQATFSFTIARIERGVAKPSTIKEFFGKLGYVGNFNEWERAFSIPSPMGKHLHRAMVA